MATKSEKGLTFTVHASYFTQTNKKTFKIYTTEEDLKKNSGVINLRKIRKYIHSLYPNWHYFRVRTTRAIQLSDLSKTGDVVFFNETQKEVELKSNPSYYDRLLTRYFNDETLSASGPTKTSFRGQSDLYYVDLSQMNGSHVFIQPPIADIAKVYYDAIDFSFRHFGHQLDYYYEILLYDRNNENDRILLQNYISVITQKNNTREFPLSIILPGDSELATKDTFLIFIAVKENQILGYCVTELLPFRAEIGENIRDLYRKTFLSPSLEKNENEVDVKEKSLLFIQYPGNLFEIQGLSVDPEQTGRRIGQRLIQTALEFINDTRSQYYFAVTNVVSWSASFVTKLITKRLKFQYYGTNRFLNEHFIETLPIDRLDQFLSIMLTYSKEALRLIENLLYFHATESKLPMSYTDHYKHLFGVALSLLQLYFIVLYSTQKGQRKGITPSLSLNLTLMLFRSQALFIYTKKILSLNLIKSVTGKELTELKRWKSFFNDERETLFLNYSSIQDINLVQLHGHLRVIENGFLSYKTVPKDSDEHRVKECCPQGYDILFDIHYSLLLLESNYVYYSEKQNLPGLFVDFQSILPPLLSKMIAFIGIDLKKPRNTIIPWKSQLVKIKEKLPLILNLLVHIPKPLERFAFYLDRQIIRQERWEMLLKLLTDVLYQTQGAILLFDTILDFSDIADVLKELNNTYTMVITENVAKIQTTTKHISLYPAEIEERRRIFSDLVRLKETLEEENSLVLFRGHDFTTDTLVQYFDNLRLLLGEEPIYIYNNKTVVNHFLSVFFSNDSILNRINL